MMLALSKLALAAGLALVPVVPVLAEPADVLARPIARGEVLSSADFTAEDVDPAHLRDALEADMAAGMEAARNLRAGYPVRSRDVMEPRLVRRGEQVSIVLRDGALSIGATGRALDDGARGDRVRVFNEATNHTLEGTVEAAGRIHVIPG